MKIVGLKVLSVKDWRPASVFVTDAGTKIDVPSNQKVVFIDDIGDIVNVTVPTDKPLAIKGGMILDVRPISTMSHNTFGWTVKAYIV